MEKLLTKAADTLSVGRAFGLPIERDGVQRVQRPNRGKPIARWADPFEHRAVVNEGGWTAAAIADQLASLRGGRTR